MGIPQNVEDMVYPAVVLGELTIDDQGRIWRTAARRWDRWQQCVKSIPCAPRRAEKDIGEYLMVRAMFDGRRWNALAHRLVWRHFKGPIPVEMTINHRDGNKKHNAPDNLELATHSDQMVHAVHVLGYNPTPNLFRG